MEPTRRTEMMAAIMTGKTRQYDSSPDAQTAALDPSFEEIFLTHWAQVYNLLVRLVGDPAEAEDLAQEAFLRLHDHPPKESTGWNPGGWLYRVATHLGLDSIRGWKRRERYELDAGKDALDHSPTFSPAEILMRKEERRHVRQVLSEMSPRAAQLLVLRYSGLSYQEIAAVSGVAPTSIGTLLLRAEKEFERRYHTAGLEEKP
jgi:RNA polymerase sigma-70 factor, ECF subfamily